MLLALSLSLSSVALASDDPERDFKGGLRTARAGTITGTIGLGALAVGALATPVAVHDSSSGAVALAVIHLPVGVVTSTVGFPLLNVGAMRAARAVEAAGGHASQLPGYLGYGLYAGGLTMTVNGLADGWWFDERVAWFGPITGALFVGAYGCAWGQLALARNRGAEVGLTRDVVVPPRRTELPDFWFTVSPLAGSAPGLVISGGF